MKRNLAASAVMLILCCAVARPQEPAGGNTSLPHLIRFSGTLTSAEGAPRSATVGVTFALFKDQTGGAPLWQEVQNVTLDATGHYSVLLGANSKDGVPAELFTSNEARWLGVQVEQEAEQPRVLLVSVPYALKAGDAETVGGHPLSDFVLSAATPGSSTASGSTNTTSSATKSSATSNAVVTPLAGTVGAGSLNAVAKYDNSGNLLGSTFVFDTGSALGVGTQTPAAALDVNNTTAPASGVSPFGLRAINALTVGQTNNFPQNNFSSVYSGTGTQSFIYGLVNNVQKTGAGPITNAYGVLSSVQNLNATGSIGNAFAFLAQAPVTTGPITNSYAFYAEDPNSINYFAGKVGIGTNTPQAGLDISLTSAPASGVSPNGFRAVGNITLGQTNNFPQNNFSSVYSGTGTQSFIYGLVNNVQKTGAGPITNAYGVLSSVQNLNATGSIGNAFAFLAQAPVTTGPITNSYAFYAEDPNSINYFAGKVGVGTVTPGQKLSVAGMVESTSGGFTFPDGSVQATALPNGCTTNQIPKWNGTAWTCQPDSNSGGTVTSITAGTGLSGGAITGSGVIAVDPSQTPLLAAPNTFIANQVVNGNLSITGIGHGISFPDGSTQTVAASGSGGILSFTLTMPSSTSIASGTCITQGITATGATTSMAVSISPNTDPTSHGLPELLWSAFVDSADHVTAQFCHFSRTTDLSTGAVTFNVRVIK